MPTDMHTRRTPHAVPTPIPIFASCASPLAGKVSVLTLVVYVVLSFVLVESADFDVAVVVNLAKSLLSQATNISGAMPKME